MTKILHTLGGSPMYYQCKNCQMIPSNQDLVHRYVSNPKLIVFDRCNRCGGKHELQGETVGTVEVTE